MASESKTQVKCVEKTTTSSPTIVLRQEEKEKPSINKEVQVKHPLENSWTLWYFKNDRSKSWEVNQKPVISVQTIEDFWAIINYTTSISEVGVGCDYSLFKTGIKPMWEDEKNCEGGRWLINLDKSQRQRCLNQFWMETMLCLIGEAFEKNEDIVNGAVVNVRNRGDKISLWMSNSTKMEGIMSVGRTLKNRMGLDKHLRIGFEVHKDAMNKQGSMARNKYTL